MTDTTTKTPELGREIATTADGIDITRGYSGPLLVPFDSVLRNRGGYDLAIYEQVRSDEEVKATLGQRQSAVVKCEWRVDSGGERRIDKQAAQWLEGQLKSLNWDNVTEKMLYGVFYGYAVAELIYAVQDDKIGIRAIKVRDRKRFRYGKDGDLRLLTQASMFEGIPAERPYFWDFCCGADHDDEPYGLGLAHWLYWPVLFKRNGIKFWLIFLEKFGMPTGVGRYDTEATSAEKAALLQATRAIHVDSGVIIPKGMELDLIEAARSGTADYKTLFDTMNASIQKAVLGQTASTQGTPGKLGSEDLQSDVRDDLVKADADLVCESFNRQVVPQLMAWNFPGAALPRVWRVTEADEDLTVRSERDDRINKWGFKPTLAYVTETYGGVWTETQPPAPALAPGQAATPSAIDGATFADPGAAVTELLARHGAHNPDPPQRMTARLEDTTAPMIDDWYTSVRARLDQAIKDGETMEQFRDALFELLPELSIEQYAKAMQEAFTAAGLAGSYEVLRETGPGPAVDA